MILVKTRVQPSNIHGLGLFAMESIPPGTPIWRFEPGFDREFSEEQLSALPEVARAHLQWFSFIERESGHRVLSGDHACFMNHAAQPNTGASADGILPVTTVALRAITAGEELTCDYWSFDAAAGDKVTPVSKS